ncbi:MAG: dTMP kinase [Candidatus Marinimicrobia bacterium]|nr:dTMP kinase [Candidatus Neomarinimicrobiota bacterium]|tara:strand:- start:13476 stop:14096 length:621 start_codon:yes stop_codon:yes gene_type:complete
MKSGYFFSFEGIDGCGKSTQINYLSESLTKLGKEVITLREPGGTQVSEAIRSILLDPNNKMINNDCEALLMAASRAQLVREIIVPEIISGKVILCDRYFDSSLAYQVAGRGLSEDWIREINRFSFELAQPDKTFFLHLSIKDAISRFDDRDQDRIESSGIKFLEKVGNSFITLAEEEPERYITLNGLKKPDLLAKEIFDEVRKIIE